jgi:hypothetical protein
MTLSCPPGRFVRVAMLGGALSGAATSASAQERPPVVEAVALETTAAARTLPVGGRLTLVSELHLTNVRGDTVQIRRVRVVDAADTTRALADLSGDSLGVYLQAVARGPSRSPTTTLAPGVRRVLYGWFALRTERPPGAVRHVVEAVTPRGPAAVVGPAVRVSGEPPVVLGPPLRGGDWAALYDPLLPGGHRMAFYTIDGMARIPARFAIDFVRLGENGTFDARSRAADRNGYGSDVLAVADGRIADAVDDMPDDDDTPGAARPSRGIAAASGNHVVLEVGGGRYVFYEHLAAGSVAVRRGQRVRAGDVIARLGNSGSSSIGPHLHFHVADAPSTLGAEGVPFVFRSVRVRGAFADIGAFANGSAWRPGPDAGPRSGEHPAPNTVLVFP